MQKIILMSLFLFAAVSVSQSQEALGYQQPHKDILTLADAPMPPSTRINSKGDYLVLMERSRFKTIAEMSETELRLGGLRINPVTNISSRENFVSSLAVQKVGTSSINKVAGLPEKGRYSNFRWSPNEKLMAFTNTTLKGVELWVLNIEEAKATKLTTDNLNANMGVPFVWNTNNMELIVKVLPKDKKALIDKTVSIPSGPTISTADGRKAQNRTYQDLLKDKDDEFNFEQLALSDLYLINIDGNKRLWKETAMYDDIDYSPDGKYVMVSTIHKPFSYIVPYYRFPQTTIIYDHQGNIVNRILEVPLTEVMPKGFMAVRTGKRSLRWRSDKAATLYWVEALDEGDPAKEVEYRDEVFELAAPFNGKVKSLYKSKLRFGGITWGNENTAIATEYWWNTRMVETTLFNPSDNTETPRSIVKRNYQDKYNDPGNFITEKNEWAQGVLAFDKGYVYLTGRGYSPEGIRPFVDKMNLKTFEKKRLWRADGKTNLENIVNDIDVRKGLFLTSIQSKSEYPNYYIRNIKSKKAPQQITFTENPFKSIQNVHKEIITYKREDGLELSATMYLPVDFEKGKKYPMILWAYPKEFKDKANAGQVSSSTHEFTYPWYGSPIFWVNRGYVVLDDAAFPIVGEGDTEPNDSFIKQLVGNAKAAIDAVDAMGYIDRNRVACGGHSYGAFMVANLLTHSDLFAAGLARSGAYNRTLTPFGFQAEERSYWEAPKIYYNMSPFMHADKMKSALLLVHGGADNNSGTYPMQSERYFNALKGLGATARLVILPKESHGYTAKESILHMLWETDEWLEKYVKNAK